jgi:hypothetical protein
VATKGVILGISDSTANIVLFTVAPSIPELESELNTMNNLKSNDSWMGILHYELMFPLTVLVLITISSLMARVPMYSQFFTKPY